MIVLKTLKMVIMSSQGRGPQSALLAATFLSGKGQTPIVSFESYTVSVETIQPCLVSQRKAQMTYNKWPLSICILTNLKETEIWLSCIFYVSWNIVFLLVFLKIYLKIQKSFLAHRLCLNRLQWIWAMTCNLPTSNFCHWLSNKALSTSTANWHWSFQYSRASWWLSW